VSPQDSRADPPLAGVPNGGPSTEVLRDTPPERRSRLRPRSVLALAFQLICVAYVVRVIYTERGELRHAVDLDLGSIAVLFALMFIGHLQRTFEFTYMLRRLNVAEPFREGFLLTGAGYLLNYLPFNAGLVMRAAVLKRDHSLPYAKYLALVTVNALINLAVAAVLGVVSVVTADGVDSASLPLLSFYSLALLGAFALVFLPRTWIPDRPGFVYGRLRSLADGMAALRTGGRGLVVPIALAFSKVCMAGVRMWICFGVLGTNITVLEAGMLASTTVLFTLVNVTPGNLGLRELALAALSTQLGNDYARGIAAASIDRVVLLAYTLVAGLPGLYALRGRGPFRAREGA